MPTKSSQPTPPADVWIAEIDGAKARTMRSFYPRVAKSLHFPAYFGKNLDALFDCICSLDDIEPKKVVLLIHDSSEFLSKEKEAKKAAVLDLLRDAEKPSNRYDGKQFSVELSRSKGG